MALPRRDAPQPVMASMWPVATWQLCRNFVLSQLALRPPQVRNRPLIVGVQGPQGSGKSTLVHRLAAELSSGGYRLRVAVLSIDDLYLPAADLEALRLAEPDNPLLAGRGLPGTHDVALGERILKNLRGEPLPPEEQDLVYPQTTEKACLPVYDKGAHGGLGDRSANTSVVNLPRELDVFLLEGWCLGFAPLGRNGIKARYNQVQADVQAHPHSEHAYLLDYPVHLLESIDAKVEEYAKRWCSRLDAMVQLWPVKGLRAAMAQGNVLDAPKPMWTHVFHWRLEAEHKLRAETGQGMTDEQVNAFIARYMPAYEMWAATGDLARLASVSMLGMGPADEVDKGSSESQRAVNPRPLSTDWDEAAMRSAMEDFPHAAPQCRLRIELDARRSVQHFTLF